MLLGSPATPPAPDLLRGEDSHDSLHRTKSRRDHVTMVGDDDQLVGATRQYVDDHDASFVGTGPSPVGELTTDGLPTTGPWDEAPASSRSTLPGTGSVEATHT